MKFLTKDQLSELSAEVQKAASNGMTPQWEKLHSELSNTSATIILPNGELMNKNIEGFVWAWRMKNMIQQCPIPKGARLNAHGLEGCFKVSTNLMYALLVYHEVEQFRIAVSLTD